MKQILVELIRPLNCSSSKITSFKEAFKPYVDAGTGIEIIADYSDVHSVTDFNSRYRGLYQGGSSESCRYNGLFGSRADVGSLWADNPNMHDGTITKVNEMLAIENEYDISSSYSESGGTISIKVSAVAPAMKKCNLVILLIDSNNHFKQILISKVVSVSPLKKTVKLTAISSQYPDSKVVVLLQDINYYAADGHDWGMYEYEVFCVTQSLKK